MLGAILVVSAATQPVKATTITTWVQAISSACICDGKPWDVGSSFNTGQVFGTGGVASNLSGPFTDNYLFSSGSQFAEGWSSATTLGVLKASAR